MKLFLLTIFHLSGVIAFAPTRSYTHSTRTNTSASTTTIKSAATSSSSPRITSESMSELDKNGYLILEDWLSKDLTQELRDDINNLRSKGKFNVARIGQDSTNTLNTDIRIAETCFLGESKLQDVSSDARSKLYEVLDNLRVDLSGNEILDENDTIGELIKAAPALDKSLSELLYAYYPMGYVLVLYSTP
jgi:hypothetical protein